MLGVLASDMVFPRGKATDVVFQGDVHVVDSFTLKHELVFVAGVLKDGRANLTLHL